jgi:hypothetical protein
MYSQEDFKPSFAFIEVNLNSIEVKVEKEILIYCLSLMEQT